MLKKGQIEYLKSTESRFTREKALFISSHITKDVYISHCFYKRLITGNRKKLHFGEKTLLRCIRKVSQVHVKTNRTNEFMFRCMENF